jgi:hypothetical protein
MAAMKMRWIVWISGIVLATACGPSDSGPGADEDAATSVDGSSSTIDAGATDGSVTDGAPPDSPVNNGIIGATCDDNSDCGNGICLTEAASGRPGGSCALACDPSAPACPGSSECLEFSPGEGYCEAACAGPGDCRDGYTCADMGAFGICVPDCESGSECSGGTCNPYSGICGAVGSGGIDGDACTSNSDCESGWCFTESGDGYPQGTCTSLCSATSNFCPDQGLCADFSDGSGPEFAICFDTCASSNDCRAGYMCVEENSGAGFCIANCTSDAECDNNTCNESSGYCTATVGAVDGSTCTSGSDCASGYCGTEAGSGNPRGVCNSLCDPSSGGLCPGDSVCVDYGSADPGEYGICFDGCVISGNCRGGYACFDVGGGEGACWPDCTSDSECAGGTCNENSGLCEAQGAGKADGEACLSSTECESNFCMSESTWGQPGGMCSSYCDPGDGAAACPSGGECISFTAPGEPIFAVCIDGCDATATCRAGYSCLTSYTDAGTCQADCTSDAQCGTVGTCNLYSGLCESDRGVGIDGAACDSWDDCESGFCLSESGYGYPGGICISECDPRNPACPDGGSCLDYSNGPTGPGWGVCWTSCAATTDCRGGYGCWDFGGGGLCNPDCSAADCSAVSCNPYSGYCEGLSGTGIDGAACTTDAGCESGFCLDEPTYGWPGGYCISSCTPSRNNCPPDASDGVSSPCYADATYGDYGICYDGCSTNGHCRQGDGYSCSDGGSGLICY